MRRTERRRKAAPARRLATGKQKRNPARQASRRSSDALSRREKRTCIQLVACGGIFVLLVTLKLLLPGHLADIGQRIGAAMESNIDVQAVFSVIGQAAAGETAAEEVWDGVYHAVFAGQEAEVVMQTAAITADSDTAALETLRTFRKEQSVAGPEEEPAGEAVLTSVLYSQENLPEGVSMEQAVLGFDYTVPVSGTVSSSFGYRDHPTVGAERFHYGVDLAAEEGTKIACFADGTVKAVGESSSYGKYLIVTHEGGTETLYAHCSAVTASSGQTVKRGETIAKVGETGMATGPHLHFELQREGIYLNPIYYVAA
ncbi:MAG: M23 family metallopeptidase [Oscillibacter sp.]|nr:M23 family metallopeptidase [Oscillibacter sp.]